MTPGNRSGDAPQQNVSLLGRFSWAGGAAIPPGLRMVTPPGFWYQNCEQSPRDCDNIGVRLGFDLSRRIPGRFAGGDKDDPA